MISEPDGGYWPSGGLFKKLYMAEKSAHAISISGCLF